MIERIASPKRTKEILKNYEFVFQKKYGQNFLIDLHVLDKIITAADIKEDETVIEIGPGIGSLTQLLAEKAKEVIAIEIDQLLIPILEETLLSDYHNITLINEDVLKVDFKQLIEERGIHQPVKIVANLPYYITTPIIMGLFEKDIPIHSITVMVQKEVAERMQAGPGTKDYGALSLSVKYYATPYIVAYVPQNCFIPRPNVGSAVIKLTKNTQVPVEVADEKLLFKLIRATFNQRRKTLVRSLINQLGIEKEVILDALDLVNLPSNIRGEALTLEQFAALTNAIKKL